MSGLMVGTGPIGLDAEGERVRASFAGALREVLRQDVAVRAGLSYAELLGWVGRREVHLAWLGPALFVQAQARFGVEALVRAERDGRQTFRGALFVREPSPMRSAEDLHGARVAWVDPDSCAGFLLPRIAMARRGLDPDATFSEQRFVGSHAAVVEAVAQGRSDVGASYVELRDPRDPSSDVVRAGWQGARVAMRPLLVTDPVPSDVIVATRAIVPSMRAAIGQALRTLDARPEGRAALGAFMQASALRPVRFEEYASVRDALRAAGVRV